MAYRFKATPDIFLIFQLAAGDFRHNGVPKSGFVLLIKVSNKEAVNGEALPENVWELLLNKTIV